MINHKVFIPVILFFTFFGIMELDASFESTNLPQAIASSTSQAYVFDVHNVLVQKNARTFICGGLGNFLEAGETFWQKARIIPQLLCASCDPRIWYEIYQLRKVKNKITESYFNILKKYGYSLAFKTLVAFSSNIFEDAPGVQEFLKNLQDQHYKLYLLSNIGPACYQDLSKKHPWLNTYFSHGNSINQTTVSGAYTVHKPQVAAYQQAYDFIKKTNPTLKPEHITFVDDKEKNLEPARKLDWKTLLFRSLDHLKNQLY